MISSFPLRSAPMISSVPSVSGSSSTSGVSCVEALLGRPGAPADNMRSIFSYDVILDAIRLVVGRGHVDFVETLAEEVAAVLLQHARVRSVRVNIRKLDVIEGAVGVEIRRERASGSADVRPVGVVDRGA